MHKCRLCTSVLCTTAKFWITKSCRLRSSLTSFSYLLLYALHFLARTTRSCRLRSRCSPSLLEFLALYTPSRPALLAPLPLVRLLTHSRVLLASLRIFSCWTARLGCPRSSHHLPPCSFCSFGVAAPIRATRPLPIDSIMLFTSPLVASGPQCYLGSYLFLREGGPYTRVNAYILR